MHLTIVQAEELILNMAHLIADDGDLPKEFIEFLQNFARFKFIMEVRVSLG